MNKCMHARMHQHTHPHANAWMKNIQKLKMQKKKMTIFSFLFKKTKKKTKQNKTKQNKTKIITLMLNLRGSQNMEWDSVESA